MRVALNATSFMPPPLASRVRTLPSAVYMKPPSFMKATGKGNRSSPEVTALPLTTRLPPAWNTNDLPSGVHCGMVPAPTGVGAALPFMGTVKMVPVSTKATVLPSGETTGLLSAPLPWVSALYCPSSVTDQILYCLSLLRSDENTTLLPSGVQVGSRSSK